VRLWDLWKNQMTNRKNINQTELHKETGLHNSKIYIKVLSMQVIAVVMTMSFLLVLPCRADNTFQEGAKNVGKGFQQIGKGSGQAFKEGGKEVGQGFKKMGQYTGNEAKKTGTAIGKWFRDGGKKTGEAFRQMGRDVRKFFTGG